MELNRVKGKPLSKDETRTLVNLIANSPIITTKETNASNNKLKNEEWVRLTVKFNAAATFPRNAQQLRLKWENLKKNSRKRSTKIRMNQIKTGGGPPDYIPPDDILDQVNALLGSTSSGFAVPFGGDRELERQSPTVSVVESEELPLETPQQTQDLETQNKKRLTFGTHRAVINKKNNGHRAARNMAIAEYFIEKKEFIKMRKELLEIKKEKLLLEIEKIKENY